MKIDFLKAELTIDYEKLSQIGKIAPSVAKDLRQEIVRYSKASKEFDQFGGLADFNRLRKTAETLADSTDCVHRNGALCCSSGKP